MVGRRTVRARIVVCALAVLSLTLRVQAEGMRLSAEFWAELDGVPQSGDPYPLPPDLAARRLLEEAAWVFAGMVYGFDFSYEPLDLVRGIKERFALTPRGEIAWGDPRLLPGEARTERARVFARVEFEPDAADQRELEAHGSPPWAAAQGSGRAEFIRGWLGRRAAYEDAAREAVRSYLRTLEPNKPRRAFGRIAFATPPRVAIVDGHYVVQGRFRVMSTETRPYGVY